MFSFHALSAMDIFIEKKNQNTRTILQKQMVGQLGYLGDLYYYFLYCESQVYLHKMQLSENYKQSHCVPFYWHTILDLIINFLRQKGNFRKFPKTINAFNLLNQRNCTTKLLQFKFWQQQKAHDTGVFGNFWTPTYNQRCANSR